MIQHATEKDGVQTPKKRIFVTVGTDLPFDRLAKAIDDWARENKLGGIFAQIGETNWKPSYISYQNFLEPPVFKNEFLNADIIVSHAGMGTILSSLQYQKPLIVMPRKASLGEHRNEHQLATAKHLQKLNKINVASDENELLEMLSNLDSFETREPIGPYAHPNLTDTLRQFIAQ
ncbi:Glycosyltransferase family 28 C-terminal domain [Verrucomicrobiia bacterium DG1235]|nr:Glycosyltransferase family 28 C-terminal domain [Verrucomicrobiae bacterium DG1235]